MTGERTGELYQIGDRMMIEVKKVNLDDRKIDFSCIKHEMQGRKEAIMSAKPKRKTAKTNQAAKKYKHQVSKKQERRAKRRKSSKVSRKR
jgi:ribonuclease R